MINQKLLKKVSDIVKNEEIEIPEEFILILEVVKQLCYENNELLEYFKGFDETTVQVMVSEPDLKFWVKFGMGKFEYKRGIAKNPSSEIHITLETLGYILQTEYRWRDMSAHAMRSSFRGSTLKIEGEIKDALYFGEFLGSAMKLMPRKKDFYDKDDYDKFWDEEVDYYDLSKDFTIDKEIRNLIDKIQGEKARKDFLKTTEEIKRVIKRNSALIVAQDPVKIKLTKQMADLGGFTSIIADSIVEAQERIDTLHKALAVIYIDHSVYGEQALDFYNKLKADNTYKDIKIVLLEDRHKS